MTDENYLADPIDYDLERVKLARRRKIAEQLIGTPLPEPIIGAPGGVRYAANGPAGAIGTMLSRAAGQVSNDQLDAQDSLLGGQQVAHNRGLLSDAGLDPNLAQAGPGIRDLIAKQMGVKAAAEERGAQLAADRAFKAEEAEKARIEKGEQQAADRVSREELRQMPSIHISNSGGAGNVRPPSGYQWNADRTELVPIKGGPQDPAVKGEKPLNESQGNAMIYGTRAAQANNVLDEVGVAYSPIKLDMARGAEKIPGGSAAANTFLLGENDQKVAQAQRNFINAVLRRESGAAIAPSEFDNARKQYFPQQGDSDALLAQKKANRELVIKGLGDVAGPQGQKAVEAERANKPEPTPPKKTVVREVKLKDGRTGVEYSDGSRGYKQ